MPLSDHEKRMLQEMEAALMTEDPRLVSALSGEVKPLGKNRILLGLGLVVLGILVLFTGLISKTTPVGVLASSSLWAGSSQLSHLSGVHLCQSARAHQRSALALNNAGMSAITVLLTK